MFADEADYGKLIQGFHLNFICVYFIFSWRTFWRLSIKKIIIENYRDKTFKCRSKPN